MDPDTVVGRKHITGTRGFRCVYFEELDQTTRDLIEKGERYDALKAHADELESVAREAQESLWGTLARYRDFTKQEEP